MGGMSGIIAGNTKREVRQLAREWYQKAFAKEEMYPRLDITDFPDKKVLLQQGCEELVLVGNLDNAVICIKLMEDLKEIFFYQWLKPEAKTKKFGCVVSAHC